MNELCFNSMNRSAYFLPEEDPDLLGQIAAAGRAGFAGFGPDGFSIDRFCREGGRVEALRDAIAAAGMRTLELPTLGLSKDRDQNAVETQRLVEIASVLSPDFVQLNIESAVDDGLLDDFRRAGDAFSKIGTRMAIEYLPWLPEVRDLKSTRGLLDRASVEGAGVLVDTWHFTLSEDTWSELESLALEEIAYIQFDDHPKLTCDDLIEETVSRRVMPGDGVFELDRFCGVIREKGYAGFVSCEVLSAEMRGMDLDAFAQLLFEKSVAFWPESDPE